VPTTAFTTWSAAGDPGGGSCGRIDGTGERLRRHASDRRVRVLTNESNLGLAAALNKGLEAARAVWVARIDADDEAAPIGWPAGWRGLARAQQRTSSGDGLPSGQGGPQSSRRARTTPGCAAAKTWTYGSAAPTGGFGRQPPCAAGGVGERRLLRPEHDGRRPHRSTPAAVSISSSNVAPVDTYTSSNEAASSRSSWYDAQS
jgi:hypothetical protein